MPETPTIVCTVSDVHFNGGSLGGRQGVKNMVVANNPAHIFISGDIADSAFDYEYSQFGSVWGSEFSKLHPSPGNHDNIDINAYKSYFNSQSVTWSYNGSDPWYAFNAGPYWRIYSLDANPVNGSNHASNSSQLNWLRADLAANPARHSIVYCHGPRWAAVSYLNFSEFSPIWDAVKNAGGDLYVAGHDHSYQRYAKQTSGGALSAVGLRELISATGGYDHRSADGLGQANNLEFWDNQNFGFVKLSLYSDHYDWAFIGTGGSVSSGTVIDSGTTTTNMQSAATLTATAASGATSAVTARAVQIQKATASAASTSSVIAGIGIPGSTQITATGLTATVPGLLNGVSYTVTVRARNAAGPSVWSAASAPVTPLLVGAKVGTVLGLTNGTAYTFTVKARNSAGLSAASTVSNSVTPTGTLTVPGAPTAPFAVAGNTQATVSWTPPASSGSAPIMDYTITAVLVVPTVPGTPAAPTAVAGNAAATVSFNAPASDGNSPILDYTVTSSPGAFTATGASPLTVSGLTNTTAYTFTVKARNVVGLSAASAASNSVTPTAPATVPGAPTIGTATAGNAQATVAFTAPGSNGGSAILDYTATSSPGGLTATAASSPITVPSLVNGTAYTFTVKARNAIGLSTASAASNSVTPAAAATVPGTPTGLSAVLGNAQATVTFTAPASNGGAAIIDYTVTSTPGSFTSTGASSPRTVSGLTNGTAYTFKATARNSVGSSAASAASNSVTPATVPGAPTIGTATAGNAQATVAFTAPGSTGGSAIIDYTVTSTPGGFSSTGAASPRTVTGLTNGTAYTFAVTARNAIGSGSASAASNSITPAVPGNANLAPYSSFQAGAPTTGWTITNCTAALDTTHAYVGNQSLKMTQTSSGSAADVDFGPLGVTTKIPCTPSQVYMVQGWCYSTVAAVVVLGLNWYSGGSYLSSSATTWQNPSANTWTQVTLQVTAPATSTGAQFDLTMPSVNASGTVVWWDALKMETGSTATAWTPGPNDPAGSPAPF